MAKQTIFHEITLRNFKSFGNNLTTLIINQNVLTLIIGKNLDDSVNGQIDSNGAGKTTILEALSYASYGKTIEDIKVDDLINNINKKNMEVSFVIERNDKFYRIMRYRKNKDRGGTGVSIFEGDTLNDISYDNIGNLKDIAEAGTVDKQIETILGVPFEIFSRIIIFSANHTPFLSLKTIQQKEIIEELLGMTELSEKAEKLKKTISFEKKELETLEEVEKEIIKQREKIQQQIDSITSRVEYWETTKQNDLNNLSDEFEKSLSINFDQQLEYINRIKSIDSIISSTNVIVQNLIKETDSLHNQLTKKNQWDDTHHLALTDIKNKIKNLIDYNFDDELSNMNLKDSVIKLISQIENLITTHNSDIKNYNSVIDKTSEQIIHLSDNKCPYCLQQYSDAKTKIIELNSLLDNTNEKKDVSFNKLNTLKDQLESAKDQLNSINSNLNFTSIDAIHTEKNKQTSLKTQYEQLMSQSNPYADGLDMAQEIINDNELNLNEYKNSLSIMLTDKRSIQEHIIFNSEIELEKNRFNYAQLEIKIKELNEAVNPHLDTLKDIQSITFDESNSNKISELSKSIEHKTFLHKLLTKPDSFIRKSLLADRLKYLNHQMRYYLDILSLPHKVEFTEELDATITKLNNPLDYNRLSSGQKARVNIALAFAFRDVLQSRFGRINICILDECLDIGLSNVGIQNAVSMIKKVATDNQLSMFVISHRDEIVSSFNNVLEIELANGFSSIK